MPVRPDGTAADTGPAPGSAVAEAPAVRVGALESTFDADLSGEPLDRLGVAICADGVDPEQLTEFFDRHEPVVGADYQHAYPLPNGRVLWLFQDVLVPTPSGPHHVHNAGLLQSGRCFQLLVGGSGEAPRPYLFGDMTEPFERWFWPLGGDVGTDGMLHVFVAEMRERTGPYLTRVEPVATWLVTIDPDGLRVVERRRAPDDSAALYGWDVVSAGPWTYLYAHCYRQFGWDPLWFDPAVLAHDWDCVAEVTVARIPQGEFDADPAYWDGTHWVADAAAAVGVIPTAGRRANPTQVGVWRGRFVAVTKVNDWWGEAIHLDVAPAAQGPWSTYLIIPVEPECDVCNTYFASYVPFGADLESLVVGLSCNVWTGDDLDHYTPTFLRVPTPPC